MQTYIDLCIHSNFCNVFICTYIHTYAYVYLPKYMYTYIPTYTCMYACKYVVCGCIKQQLSTTASTDCIK